MIKYFSSIYAGHIDFDDLGNDATPANDRRYSNEKLLEALDSAVELGKLMDDLGYHTLWLAEHHFQHEGYECIPNIPLLAMHILNQTKRIKVGCGFNIILNWHPIRLAEDYAVVDYLSNGRFTFGVGRGYHSREVEGFSMPMLDREANREVFEEQLEIIIKAFNEESFSHQGKHYQIPPSGIPYRGYEVKEVTLVPRPVRRPVDIWQPVVSGSQRGMDFMARHGIKGVIANVAEHFVKDYVASYRDAVISTGREIQLGEDIMLGYRMFMDDTVDKAMDNARLIAEEYIKFSDPLGLTAFGEQQTAVSSSSEAKAPGTSSLENGIATRVWLCGPADEFISYLKELEETYPGLEHVMVSPPLPASEEVSKEQLTRFAKEVMPAFTNRAI